MNKRYAYRPSSLGRVKLCPGSVALTEKLIREGKGGGFNSPEAQEGTMLHRCVEQNEIAPDLNEEQINAVQKCIDYKTDRVVQAYPDSQIYECYSEKALHLYDGVDLSHLLSGTIDFVALEGRSGFIIDWKFGRLPLPEVSVMLQLACYSAMTMQHFELDTVAAFVYMPRGGWEYKVKFEGGADNIIKNIILPVLKTAETEGAPRQSSFEACQYCRALQHCPEAMANLDEIAKLDVVSPVDPETVDDMIEKIKIAGKIGDEYMREAKAYYENGGESSRWGMISRKGSLKLDGGTRSVYDTIQQTITIEEFMSVCRVSLPKLRKLYIDKKGLDKKSGNEEFDRAIDPLSSRGKDVQVLQKKRDQTNEGKDSTA